MRLIDADALKKTTAFINGAMYKVVTAKDIEEAPTIETPVVEVKIDTDALKDRLKEYCVDGDSVVQNWYEIMGIDSCIDNAPTVDAVEVVRCKDCKYSIDRYNDGDCYCRHPKYNGDSLLYIQDGWRHYCSYGERKDK